MSDTNLESILNELFELDPSLRQREAEVRRVVQQLMVNRPSISISENFLHQLETKLMQQESQKSSRSWPMLIGLPAIGIAVVAGILFFPKKNPSLTSTTKTNKLTITSGAASAFGTFATDQHVNASRSSESTKAGSTATSDAAVSIFPAPSTVTYKYDGTITIPQLPVLQREKGFSANSSLNTGGLANLGSFSGLQVDTLSASQRTSDGYTVTVDYHDGSLSMYRASGDVSSTKEMLLVAPDRPVATSTISKTSAISASTSFASQHGISTDAYGQPFVQIWPGQANTDATKVNVPATIIFPLEVSGQPVYDESGNRYGLQMVVDGDGDVISVYNLTTLNFKSSAYAVTSSTKAITDYLNRGAWSWAGKPIGATTPYTLTTPTTGYMLSRYQVDQTASDYLVPALIFPVAEKDQTVTGRTNIVVPVLDSLLKEQAAIQRMDLPASTGNKSSVGSTEPSSR